MKLLSIVCLVLFSVSAHADSQRTVKARLQKFENNVGVGSYLKNNRVISGLAPCYVAVNEIDSWSSDYSISADVFEITVNGKRLGTVLDEWDFDKDKVRTEAGIWKYSRTVEVRNHCIYDETLTIYTKINQISFQTDKSCRNGVKTSEIMSCAY